MWVNVLPSALLAALLLLMPACNREGAASPPMAPVSGDASSPWHMTLRITPAHPRMEKPITLLLHLADEHGQPVSGVSVKGSLTMKTMDMGVTPVAFEGKGNGDYQGTIKSTDMSGPWGLAVEARQGSVAVKASFDINVGD